MQILDYATIRSLIDFDAIAEQQKSAFIAYSEGHATIPPVTHMPFSNPKGDYHIKSGHLHSSPYWTVKLAGSFYQNPDMFNCSTSQGVMLVISAEHGKPLYLLQDNGYLTDLRTAMVSYLIAKHILHDDIAHIGILGCGVQAKFQIDVLQHFYPNIPVSLWARNAPKAKAFIQDYRAKGNADIITLADSLEALCATCDYLVTVTAAETPIIASEMISGKKHITALGSDTPRKQELSPELLARADQLFTDAIVQSHDCGEIYQARKQGILPVSYEPIELGKAISDNHTASLPDQRLTIADCTGLAIQDIAIAESVITAFEEKKRGHKIMTSIVS